MPKISGPAVAAIGAGTLFAYAGLKGYSIPRTVQAVIAGAQPGGQAQAAPVTTPTGQPAAAGTGSAGAAAIAGGRFSNAQLQQLWIMAGGSPAHAAVAACIAQHEDAAGDPTVTSPNPDGGTNVGLWQIDTKGVGAGMTVAQLQDPLTNARAAVRGSSNGTDWSAWSTAAGCGA